MSPAAQRELAAQLQGLRSGLKARAMLTLGLIMENEGDGSAASRKVQLQAATAVLGEEARAGGVNVTINNGPQLTAGIVVRLPAGIGATPLEQPQEPTGRVIENGPPYGLITDPSDMKQRYRPIDDEADD